METDRSMSIQEYSVRIWCTQIPRLFLGLLKAPCLIWYDPLTSRETPYVPLCSQDVLGGARYRRLPEGGQVDSSYRRRFTEYGVRSTQ